MPPAPSPGAGPACAQGRQRAGSRGPLGEVNVQTGAEIACVEPECAREAIQLVLGRLAPPALDLGEDARSQTRLPRYFALRAAPADARQAHGEPDIPFVLHARYESTKEELPPDSLTRFLGVTLSLASDSFSGGCFVPCSGFVRALRPLYRLAAAIRSGPLLAAASYVSYGPR